MANRTKLKKGVFMAVDADFFKLFESERQKEQARIRIKIGGMFNLSQRKFTSILAKNKFKFQFPKQATPKRGKK